MIFWAAHAVRGRVKEKQVRVFLPTFVSMLVSYTTVASVVTAVIVQSKPWYEPSISSHSGGDRRQLHERHHPRPGTPVRRPARRPHSRRAGALPGRNLPGGHRGDGSPSHQDRHDPLHQRPHDGWTRLPARHDVRPDPGRQRPVAAIEYQIVVMLMLVASTAISSSIVVHVVRRTCFTGSSQLILR